METVRQGSHGTAARMAQMLLNDRLMELPEEGGKPFVPLVTDGIFGPKSTKALTTFIARGAQVSHLPVIDDGLWRALGLVVAIDHRVVLVGQPHAGECWSAAAAMILGAPMSVHPGGASLTDKGRLVPDLQNLRRFGESLGWQSVPPTQNASAFAGYLQRGPVWIAGQGAAANGKRYGHAVVVSGMWGDGDAHGSTTLLRIHDPWPGPRGRVYDTYFFGPQGIRLPGGVWFRPDAVMVR